MFLRGIAPVSVKCQSYTTDDSVNRVSGAVVNRVNLSIMSIMSIVAIAFVGKMFEF